MRAQEAVVKRAAPSKMFGRLARAQREHGLPVKTPANTVPRAKKPAPGLLGSTRPSLHEGPPLTFGSNLTHHSLFLSLFTSLPSSHPPRLASEVAADHF